MPRITAVPNYDAMLMGEVRAYLAWRERGDAATSHDLCIACVKRLLPSDPDNWPEALPLTGGEPAIEYGYGVEVGADHPPYAAEPSTCALCAAPLTAKDD